MECPNYRVEHASTNEKKKQTDSSSLLKSRKTQQKMLRAWGLRHKVIGFTYNTVDARSYNAIECYQFLWKTCGIASLVRIKPQQKYYSGNGSNQFYLFVNETFFVKRKFSRYWILSSAYVHAAVAMLFLYVCGIWPHIFVTLKHFL